MEMNPQEKEFLEMSQEFTGDCSETDVLQVTVNVNNVAGNIKLFV